MIEMTINAAVVDLSHWEPADDYAAVKSAGIVGVIYKATQGQSNTDDTYAEQRREAKAAGLKWGAYHFADGSDVDGQVANFMAYGCPDPDELFCLDWEDNGGDTMSADGAKDWITKVEAMLGRPGECVIYSGNTAKELIEGNDPFFGSRRLWVCQYGDTAEVQESWETYWLWQFTDGVDGPMPHAIDGIGPCDINSYAGAKSQLIAEWASGSAKPAPDGQEVMVDITLPPGVTISVTVNGEPIS
jgi:lysozyme